LALTRLWRPFDALMSCPALDKVLAALTAEILLPGNDVQLAAQVAT
jgi:hypothetical protein